MKASAIMCAMLACASLTFEARATSSPDGGRSSASMAGAGDPAGRTPPSRDVSTKAQRAGDRGSPQSRARRSVTPQPRVGKTEISPAGGGNADRLHSLLNVQAHARLARPPGHTVKSTHAATAGLGVRAPQGVKPAGQPMPARPSAAASPAARHAATPRGSAIGGARAQGAGRVGSQTVSRTTHSATIDGTQLRHKF